MSNFDFTKTLLNGSKQYIDEKTSDGSTHSHSWNDLEDRPFYETEPVETVLYEAEGVSGTNISIENMTLIEGETYTIVCNENIYTCVGTKDVYGSIYIGNTRIGNPYGEHVDTGENFYLSTYDNVGNLCFEGDSTYSIRVTYYETFIVELDSKYTPYMVGKKVDNKTIRDQYGVEYIGGVGAEIFNKYNVAVGEYSHAEGFDTKALGEKSHSEGEGTTASGYIAHAEGQATTASGYAAHSEGRGTTASGDCAHAEGGGTIASGRNSHAEGLNTIASSEYQHVQGKYNIEDTANAYAHIVGNGNYSKRSNAHTLDWNGNAWYQGSVEATALILSSPNGTRFEITVGDDGVLTATEMTIE